MEYKVVKVDMNSKFYPERLRNIYSPPKQIYCIGNLELLNYKYIWDKQSIPIEYEKDLEVIAKQVFDTINDPRRTQMNISSYCKQKVCWDNLVDKNYQLSEKTIKFLIDPDDKKIDDIRAKKEQRFNNSISVEVDVYKKGVEYWTNLLEKGIQQNLLLPRDEDLLRFAIDYCKGIKMATPRQAKAIWEIRNKLSENGVVV